MLTIVFLIKSGSMCGDDLYKVIKYRRYNCHPRGQVCENKLISNIMNRIINFAAGCRMKIRRERLKIDLKTAGFLGEFPLLCVIKYKLRGGCCYKR